MNLKDQIRQTSDLLQEMMRQPKPTLGIDLDGCVGEAPMFFNIRCLLDRILALCISRILNFNFQPQN